MKRMILCLIAAAAMAVMTCAGIAEDMTVSAEHTAVDYSGAPDGWIYIPETGDDAVVLLAAIDQCRYGAAGASLSQADAACRLLELTVMENVGSALQDYLDGMNATQLDYFSFQWQTRMLQAQEMLSAPDDYAGVLQDSGNDGFDISVFSAESLAELDALVMNELAVRGVADVWKEHQDVEPFGQVIAMNDVFQDADFYAVCTGFSKAEVEQFARNVKALILNSDWEHLSEYVAYPITIGDDEFEECDSLVSALREMRPSADAMEAVENEDCTDMFCRFTGIMMGNGEVWLSEVLNDDGTSAGLKVIALELFHSN